VGRVPNPLPLGHRDRARPFPITALGAGQLRRFRDRDVIVRQGSRPEVLFIVEEGVVALATCTRTGQRCVIDLLGPGDPFNESAIAMSASDAEGLEARAVGSCAVLAISRLAIEAELRDPLAAWLAASQRRSEPWPGRSPSAPGSARSSSCEPWPGDGVAPARTGSWSTSP
jgi:CRP-like cAMP-binding protein